MFGNKEDRKARREEAIQEANAEKARKREERKRRIIENGELIKKDLKVHSLGEGTIFSYEIIDAKTRVVYIAPFYFNIHNGDSISLSPRYNADGSLMQISEQELDELLEEATKGWLE